MRNILILWQRALRAGVHTGMNFEEVKKLRILNGIAVIYIFFNLIVSIWSYILHTPGLAVFNYAIAVFMIVIVLLNAYHHYFLSKFLFFLIITSHILVVSVFFAFGAEYYLFPLIILAGFLIKKRFWLYFYFVTLALFFILTGSHIFDIYIIHTDPEISNIITTVDGILALNFSLLTLILFINQYSENRKTILFQNELLRKTAIVSREKADYTTLLLKEMNHRVKNNLQLISSLLSLHARELKNREAKKAILDARNRIYSIALIHRQLYQEGNLTMVNITNYLNDLIPYIKDTLIRDDAGITIKIDSDQFVISLENAVSVGLILNELVTNSIKHSIKKSKEKQVVISIKLEKENRLCLSVEDNGEGLQNMKDDENFHFGLNLVQTLVSNYDGNMDFDKYKNKITIDLILEKSTYKIDKVN